MTIPAADRGVMAALVLLCALVFFAVLAERPLFNPDEGRYAEIPREMLASGEWVLPHLNGLEYIEKPPLQYWFTAANLAVLGNSALAARLYTGLCALGILVLVGLAARQLTDGAGVVVAVGSLASMPLFVLMGQLLTLDMGLTLWMTGALVAFLSAQTVSPPRQRVLMLLCWACTALGVLSKGVVAAAIPAAVLVLYSLWSRDFSPWRRLHVALGLPLFLVIALPWHALAAHRDPNFLQFFFVHEHLQRYLTTEAQRVQPWWFFPAVMLAGCLPWTASLLRAMASGFRRREAGFNPRLFLWMWTVFVVVFFSLSDSKLMPYVLPALPALSLLIATADRESFVRDFRKGLALSFLLSAVVGIGAYELPQILASSDRQEFFLPLKGPLFTIAILLAACGALLIVQRSFGLARSTAIFAASWCLAWLILIRGASSVAPIYSGEGLAQAIPAGDKAPVYCVATYDQTLPFYLGRTISLVHFRGELDYGLKLKPDAMIADLGEFIERWNGAEQSYALMEKSMFEELRGRGAMMRILKTSAERLVVARR